MHVVLFAAQSVDGWITRRATAGDGFASEADRAHFREAIRACDACVMGAATYDLAKVRMRPEAFPGLRRVVWTRSPDRRAAEACIAAMSAERLRQWIEALSLCIDETFRLGAGDLMSTLGKLDIICRIIRRRDEPFGGLKLFISGDPIQLMSGSKDAIGVHFLRSSQFQVSA